jgi:putative ABC transport system permease protein
MVQFTIWNLIWASAFLLILVFISLYKDYRIVRESVIAALKMIIQLFIMGFIIAQIVILDLNSSHEWAMFCIWIIVFIMIVNAVRTTASRGKGIPHIKTINLIGILIGATVVLFVLYIAGILEYNVIGLVPFVGSVVGNVLTKNSQGIERLIGEFKARVPEMETILSLGGTIQKATIESERKSIGSVFIPMNDAMRNAGFFLPGAAVGLIITGTPPIEAMIFQCIMFLSWCGGAIVSCSIINSLIIRQFTTINHQIRYDILHDLLHLHQTPIKNSAHHNGLKNHHVGAYILPR